MKTLKIILILLIAAAILFYVTKPSDYELLQDAKYSVSQELKSQMNGFAYTITNGLTDKIIENGISIEDNFFYKTVSFSFKGNTRVIEYGFLNSFHDNN